jgi:uroporphyrinogen-III synthase
MTGDDAMTGDQAMTSRPRASGPSRPLGGLRVFVPRSADRAGPLLAALRAAGADPVAAPLVAIGAPADLAGMDAAAARLAAGGYAWVGVTSSFAVDALGEAARRSGRTLAELVAAGRAARPGSTRFAAVGAATAATLARAGVQAELVPELVQTVQGMLAGWARPEPGGRVLLPQSDLAAPTLAVGLADRGWQVYPVVAYTNGPAAPLPADLVADLVTGRVRAVVLTSGSAARRLAAQVTLPESTLVCCIGPRTAEVAATLGLPAAVLAARPSPDAIVAALVAALPAPHPDPDRDRDRDREDYP